MTTGAIPETVRHLADLLSPLGDVRARRFFGGTGLTLDGVQFAFDMKGALYFRVDETSLPAYLELGAEPFRYWARSKTVEVASYYAVPAEIVEDTSRLLEWAEMACAAARPAINRPRRSA